MITLNDALESYCYEHKKDMPNDRHRMIIGKSVLNKIKEIGVFVPVTKVWVTDTFQVNSYPDDTAPVLNMVIEQYYTERKKLYKEYKQENKTRASCFDVKPDNEIFFEEALRKNGFKVSKKLLKSGDRQYTILYTSSQKLIKLGMDFQANRVNHEQLV